MRDEEYFGIKDRAAKIFMKFAEVNAVGLGSKEINGKPTGEIAIKVYVTQKKQLKDIPENQRIPSTFESVPTDVIMMGPPTLVLTPGVTHPQAMVTDISNPRGTGSALQGGLAISPEHNDGSGTLGCFLVDKNDSSAVYALTNHHVAADSDNRVSLTHRVGQPFAPSGMPDAMSIGVITAAIRSSKQDAAIIRLRPGTQWLAEIKNLGIVKGMHAITLAEAATGTYEVRKSGARTGVTGGIVSAIGASNNDIIIQPNPDPAHLTDPTFFAFEGDSGSVCINANDEVVALVYSREDSLTTPFVKGYCKAIGDVLRDFKNNEKYDLEVATATVAGTINSVLQPAGSLAMTVSDAQEKGDHRYYRPLVGGSQMLAHPMLGNVNAGTLGCMMKHTTQANTAYILTSHGRISQNNTVAVTTDTVLGQPDNSESVSGCCSNRIGHFAVGSITATRNAALGKIKNGMQWLAEILEIGYIKDIYTLTALDVSGGNFNVRKRGVASRLTGGVVTVVGGVHGTLPAGVNTNAMLIRPNPNPDFPTAPIFFSHFNDRGAVIVDEQNRIIGLLYDEIEEPSGSDIHYGVATPIQAVIDQFNSIDSVTVQIATATAIKQTQTTVSASRVMHSEFSTLKNSLAIEHSVDIATNNMGIDAFYKLREDLQQSDVGKLLLKMYDAHMTEISNLLNSNRRTATVWHRSGGAALMHALIKAFQQPGAVIPNFVNGSPVKKCLEQLAMIFKQYGSSELKIDIDILAKSLPEMGGLTYQELMQNKKLNNDLSFYMNSHCHHDKLAEANES